MLMSSRLCVGLVWCVSLFACADGPSPSDGGSDTHMDRGSDLEPDVLSVRESGPDFLYEPEICDGIDNDLDNKIDEGTDVPAEFHGTTRPPAGFFGLPESTLLALATPRPNHASIFAVPFDHAKLLANTRGTILSLLDLKKTNPVTNPQFGPDDFELPATGYVALANLPKDAPRSESVRSALRVSNDALLLFHKNGSVYALEYVPASNRRVLTRDFVTHGTWSKAPLSALFEGTGLTTPTRVHSVELIAGFMVMMADNKEFQVNLNERDHSGVRPAQDAFDEIVGERFEAPASGWFYHPDATWIWFVKGTNARLAVNLGQGLRWIGNFSLHNRWSCEVRQ